MRFDIKFRFSSRVLTVDIDCAADTPERVKLGLAVRAAIRARADLTGANLAGADLADANLARAYLAGADLAGANLARAYLARANLAGADLTRAYLAGANLAGAYLTGAEGAIDAGTPNGWRCVGWLQDGWLAIRVGCRNKRLAEGRAYWAGKDDRREVLAALDYVEAVARIRGWAVEQPVASDAA